MDVHTPVVNRLEAAEAIRAWEVENGGHIPIIAVTANAMEGNQNTCLNAGMDDYISKPIEPDKIHECLQRHIGRQANATPTSEEVQGNEPVSQIFDQDRAMKAASHPGEAVKK